MTETNMTKTTTTTTATKPKRILMLAWEYPPRLVGGLARVVCAISRELAAQGHDVHVITADCEGTEEYSMDAGVHVHRVKTQTNSQGGELASQDNFLLWDSRLNLGILQYAIRLHQEKPFDVCHAHDWLVADAGWVMKSFGIPMISTIHATEFGRNKGELTNANSRFIDELEWRLIYESGQVIVNSKHMLREVVDHFHVSAEKVVIIPNGIEPDRLRCTVDKATLREKHGYGDGPMLLFVGRLVHEKGVQFLLDAIPTVIKSHPKATLVIAGTGYYAEELQRRVAELGIDGHVHFFGHANDKSLPELYTMADAVVVPSLYEPFGIVALEGMAACVPTITSDNGGLVDIVKHMHNGLTTYAGDSGSLAWAILQVLDNQELAEGLKTRARAHVLEHFSWTNIAARTLKAYDEVIEAARTRATAS
jgi:glycogen synthase